jgi:hypothetical protein
LSIRYLTGARPPALPSPAPRFALNGHALEDGRTAIEGIEGLRRVTETFEIAAARLPSSVNVLTIESDTWTPSKAYSLHCQFRRLGLMLEHVSLVRAGSP